MHMLSLEQEQGETGKEQPGKKAEIDALKTMKKNARIPSLRY